jgi:hypothetical protein
MRYEWKMTVTNWLRDQINETLSRYDVHSDAYEKDVLIDALCVVAVDKIAALLDAPSGVTQPAQVSVADAARVLINQPYRVMVKAFDAMDAKQGEGSDRIMLAALRALSEETRA